jgi:uncharacterized membrane protein YfcA
MIWLALLIFGALGWFFSTVAAGGAATLLIPIIGLMISAHAVPPIISIAAFIANPSRVWLFRDAIRWDVIRYLMPGSLIGAAFGGWLLTRFSPAGLQILLGLFLISTLFQYRFGKIKRSFRVRKEWFFPLGLIISFMSGLVGATGPLLNPFMLNYGLEKENLIATKSLNSLLMQLTKITSYTLFGALSWQLTAYGITLGMGAIIGVFLAKNHLLKISSERFRKYTLILMVSTGILMLTRGIQALL